MRVAPLSTQSPKQTTASIVVIAGSAGSLTLLREILALQPRSSSAAYVVLMHRTDKPPFCLDSLLGSAGCLPASYAKHDEPLLAGHVYIAPPGEKHLVIEGGRSRPVRARGRARRVAG